MLLISNYVPTNNEKYSFFLQNMDKLVLKCLKGVKDTQFQISIYTKEKHFNSLLEKYMPLLVIILIIAAHGSY